MAHVRVLDSALAAWLRDHLDDSPALQATIQALERSDTVVHVVRGPEPSGIDGSTVFVSAAGGVRYIRVTIGLHVTRGRPRGRASGCPGTPTRPGVGGRGEAAHSIRGIYAFAV